MFKREQERWKADYIGCGDWDLIGPITQEDWVLAASAPELLEALELMYYCYADSSWISHKQQEDNILAQVKATIAKATGQTMKEIANV